ncbi:MAG TPA: tetratricopeptide repeat protein, partial [Bacteroidetes bacterium]|nr:tetratricopeptide repeat protein [Bacteroidota bacterium]
DWMQKINKPIELSGRNAEIRLFGAITVFLKKAAIKPLVICIDDLHWADEQILKWLQYAERNLNGFPILIIGLHRSEQLFEDSKLLKIENLIQIKIKNLKEIDVSEMIKSMLGKKRKNKEMNNFIENIVSHTNGNPLFIREMLYFLNKKGKISIVNNKWNFPETLEIENLPENIQILIKERLAELSSEALRTLQIASIIGTKISFEMLLHLTKKVENELLEDLIDCREVSLLEESGNDFIFIHDKIREVLEIELKEKNFTFWRELHQRAGEFLEEQYSKNPDEVLDELADHFNSAEHFEKSVKYLGLAGDRAKKHYQNEKSIDFYDRLLQIPKYRSQTKNYIDALRDKYMILRLTGKWKEAKTIIRNALKLSEEIINKERIASVNGELAFLSDLVGNFKEAMECYNKKLIICEELEDKSGIAEAVGDMGIVYAKQADYPKAMECFEKALTISEESGNRRGVSEALGNIGKVYRFHGNYEKAMEFDQKKIEITEELGDKPEIARAFGSMGNVYNNQSNYKKAIEFYEKQLKISKELGYQLGISMAIGNIGFVNEKQGNYTRAMECFKRELKISEEQGDKNGITNTVLHIGCVYTDQGSIEKAMECFERCIKISEELGDKRIISAALGNKGNVYRLQGKYEKAMKCYEKDITICEELGNKAGISSAIGNMGCVYNDQGNYTKAIECYEKYLTISEELGNKAGISISVGNIGAAYCSQGNYAKAMECLKKAIEIGLELEMKPFLPYYYSDKSKCLYRMQKYELAKKTNEECLKISEEMKNEDFIFGCKVLNAKISFHLSIQENLKIEKGIKPLE